ncbi:MAG: MerR family transcriptional regulator [Beijerinckiaceae bacterium]
MSTDTHDKAPDAYRTISEVAEDLDLPQHVLRFWETRFSHIKPLKRGGGRRYYRPDDVALIKGIQALLYGQGYTIKGVQRILKDRGVKHVQALARAGAQGSAAALPPEAASGSLDRAAQVPHPTHHASLEAQPPMVARPIAPDLVDGARRRLEAALAELSACRRLIAATQAFR